jgi:SAM-dependent methyltransferase
MQTKTAPPAASTHTQTPQATRSRPCPACGAAKSLAVRQIELVVPDSFSLQRTFSINACASCGAVFHDVEPQTDRDTYYESYTGTDVLEYTVTADQARLNDLTLRFLEHADLHSCEQSILDIGCSFGITLMALKQRGFDSLFAIDPDRSAIAFLQRQGISGSIGSAVDVRPELTGKFDLIILRHVLEHLYAPGAAIENISTWLKPGGKIYIELPDLARYGECGLFPGYFFEHEHINHFSLLSLLNLMRDFSLTHFESSAEIYPCLRGLFAASAVKRPLLFSAADAQWVNDSFSPVNAKAKNVLENIAGLRQEPIALWGVSVFVYRLLAHTPLGNCNIVQLVDNNPRQQGEKLHGMTIQAPESLRSFTGKIVICGENSADSIEKSIRALGLRNKTVRLMETPEANARRQALIDHPVAGQIPS